MMRIVAIDTATEFGSLALVEDGSVVEEILLHSGDGFAHVLFPQLERLVASHGWKWQDVEGFAAGAGPGSFTGVRVGLAAAKGLAEAAGAKAAAVSNLKAIASFGSAPLRAPFLDARRGEIYGALYNSDLDLVEPELVAPLPRWLASLPGEGVEFLTPDPAPFAAVVQARAVPRALAGAIGRLAAPLLTDPAALDANYVRRADAELKWKDR
jgi:tRNA threonylcarbamoyladenosine biosynthesis protein TsaB